MCSPGRAAGTLVPVLFTAVPAAPCLAQNGGCSAESARMTKCTTDGQDDLKAHIDSLFISNFLMS